MCRHEALADRRLAGLHGALDLAALEKRSAGMDGDVDLAARVVTDLVGEHDAHLGMEVGRGIGHRHIPLLGKCGRGRQRHGGGGCHPDHFFHQFISLCYQTGRIRFRALKAGFRAPSLNGGRAPINCNGFWAGCQGAAPRVCGYSRAGIRRAAALIGSISTASWRACSGPWIFVMPAQPRMTVGRPGLSSSMAAIWAEITSIEASG